MLKIKPIMVIIPNAINTVPNPNADPTVTYIIIEVPQKNQLETNDHLIDLLLPT